MKKLIILSLLCAFPIFALAHPGKTDKYGGHKCIKDCEEWKLYYAEYHLHDKDGKPIRVARKQNKIRRKPALKSAPTETVLPVVTEPPATIQTVTVYQYVTTVHEKEVFAFNPMLLAVLVLLLLLLILRLNRKRSENAERRG